MRTVRLNSSVTESRCDRTWPVIGRAVVEELDRAVNVGGRGSEGCQDGASRKGRFSVSD
jgi:hypothetical protein